MAVRMRDVARLAGVSEATVSLALSGSPRISEPTRARVAEIARRVGYRPHAGARALRTDSTGALGLVVSDVANPFFAELAGQIERIAAAEEYSLVLCNSDEDAARQDGYLSSLLAGSRVDGVILVPAEAMTPGIKAAASAGANLVLLDRPVTVRGRDAAATRLRDAPVVRGSAAGALADVAELLVGLGHRRVGVIPPPVSNPVGRERRDLLVEALRRHGLAGGDIAVEPGDFRQHSGERAVERLLRRRRPPTAVFAGDGLMAIGAMKALRRAGLRIPEDVSLVGFDDAPWFDLLDPPLTTVAQPITELAAAAVRAMLALLRGEPSLAAAPPCRLVQRGSHGAPPHRNDAKKGTTS
ncbi:LacI family DNA-binding transcriptional regulator [Pseudonocardia acaciae]|uniref:LacI family DNA-binding transcriptional regulator n=1 Tax=Pseudonocardia acaciae TaxID=551276 RepID=UPI000491E5E4|nr:LacI family DNA-binding transcriptional regulator [Pseudonocardia acaciae]